MSMIEVELFKSIHTPSKILQGTPKGLRQSGRIQVRNASDPLSFPRGCRRKGDRVMDPSCSNFVFTQALRANYALEM